MADLDPDGPGGGDDGAALVEEGAGRAVGAGAGPERPADRDEGLADRDLADAVRGERAEEGERPAAQQRRGKLTQSRAPQTEAGVATPSTAKPAGGSYGEASTSGWSRSGPGVTRSPSARCGPQTTQSDSACRTSVNGWARRAVAASQRSRQHRRRHHERVGGDDASRSAGRRRTRPWPTLDSRTAKRPSEGHALVQGDGGGAADEVGEGAGGEAAVGVAAGAVHARVDEEPGVGGGGHAHQWTVATGSCRHRRNRPTPMAGIGHPHAGGTVASMTALRFRGPVLPDGEARELYVVDGRVTYEKQAGAETGGEGWIVPGLVDAHCHVGLDENGGVDEATCEEQAIADRDAGALLLRDCGSPVDTSWIHDREDLPRLIRAGRHIARTKRYIRNYAHEVEPAELAASVAQEAQRGDGWVKLVGDWISRDEGDLAPSFPREAFEEAIRVAHEHGARVTAHCFGRTVLPWLIEAGIDCIEHGTGLTTDLVDAMVEHGTALVPTVMQLEQLPRSTPRPARQQVPGVRRDHPRPARPAPRDDHVRARGRRPDLRRAPTPAGCCRTAASPARCSSCAAYGFSAADALGAASWRAREWLGWNAGLEEGAPADFVVLDARPAGGPVGAAYAGPRRAARAGRRAERSPGQPGYPTSGSDGAPSRWAVRCGLRPPRRLGLGDGRSGRPAASRTRLTSVAHGGGGDELPAARRGVHGLLPGGRWFRPVAERCRAASERTSDGSGRSSAVVPVAGASATIRCATPVKHVIPVSSGCNR